MSKYFLNKDSRKYQRLKTAIQRNGVISPVLVSKNGIVLDGSHRTIIARELGIQVPVVRLDVEVTYENPSELRTWLDDTEDTLLSNNTEAIELLP